MSNVIAKAKEISGKGMKILEEPLSNSFSIIIALLSIIVALWFACTEYTYVDKGLFKDTQKTVTMMPSLLSSIAGAFVVIPFFLRSMGPRIKQITFFYIIIMALDILLCGTFISIFLDNTPWSIPLLDISSQTFVLLCILLSWLGMRSMAGITWIVLFAVGITHSTILNSAMGFQGAMYIIFTTLSIVLQIRQFYSDNFVNTFKMEFFGVMRDQIAQDINATIETGKKAANAAVQAASGVPISK